MSLDLSLNNLEIKFKVSGPQENRVFEFDNFRLDATTKLLYRGNEQVLLTPKAVETLIALVEAEGSVISKADLMRKIWADTVVEESNLAQYLHILRKTLGDTREGKPYIETLKRRGYRFNGEVRVVAGVSEFPTPSNGTAESTATHEVPSRSGGSSSRRVERRGNVLAVAEWIDTEEAPLATPVVVPQEASVAAAIPPTRTSFFSPLILLVLAFGFAAVVFGVYQYSKGGPGGPSSVVPFLGSDFTRITTTGKSKRMAMSPDGRYIAHVTDGPDGDSLMLRQVAVANDTRLAAAPNAEIAWVTFAPDGNFIYYLILERDKGETELFRVPLLGGPIIKVAHDVGAPTFSPDGTKLAYMMMKSGEARLIVATTDGMSEAMNVARQAPDFLKPNEKKLVARMEPDYLNAFWFAPAWSPDGKSLAFPVAQGDENGRYETVLAVDVETGVERKLTDERWQQAGQPRWLRDGLIVTASETSTGPQQLWYISLPDGKASRITRDLNNYQNISLSADERLLSVIQEHSVSNIWTVDANGASAKQVISEAGTFNEVIWLHDGRIAFTSNAGGSSDIWTVNPDGSGPRQLTVGANARLGLAAMTDEKHIIFAAERNGAYNLWRIGIDGSGMTRLTSGDGEYYPQCTPDGHWIVYQSGGNYPTLWKMPSGGGEAVQLTKTTASRPSLSPDGKLIAYHYLDPSFEKMRWGIGISSIEDGQRVKRFDFAPTVVERLVKWTRDGKGIAFLNSPNGIPNIWIQPVDGGPPEPLTNFPSDSISAFNWSADGSRLAVIRGVETSDVLVLNRP